MVTMGLRYWILIATAFSSVSAQNTTTGGEPGATVRFKSDTRAVQINVSVRDAEGRPVRSLRKEDFVVTDNGKPREIQLFAGDEARNAALTAPALPKGVFSNRFGPRTAQGRITAIVIDTVLTWFPWYSHIQEQAREHAIRAVERMEPGETVAVYVTCPWLRILQDYTSDRERVLDALKGFVPFTPLPLAWAPNPFGGSLAALRDVATHMSAASGRKSVIWVSIGIPNPALVVRRFPGFGALYESTIRAFNDANVALSPVDPRGVVGLDQFVQAATGLAQRTGGRAYYMRNDLDQAIAEALDDTQYTYELGFYLSATDFDGRFHELTVKVPRQPKLTLHYRQGYSASSSSPLPERKPALDQELLNATDSSGVGIDATLGVVPGVDGKELRVTLALDAGTIGTGKDGMIAVDETFVEIGANGSLAGKVQESLKLDWPGERQAARYTRTIKLPEGSYTLKIVVRDKATGHIGSLSIPLAGLDR